MQVREVYSELHILQNHSLIPVCWDAVFALLHCHASPHFFRYKTLWSPAFLRCGVNALIL